ncbi:MAG: transposase [Anaerolineae bacterium]
MERRFEIRKRRILQEAQIKPHLFNGMLKRLEQFAQPFIATLSRREQKEHAHTYIAGLLSDLKRKNTESIAYRHDQDRRGLQRFIGSVPWDHRPLLEELARQVGSQLGQEDGVIVFDPSGHKKCGNDSVGVSACGGSVAGSSR